MQPLRRFWHPITSQNSNIMIRNFLTVAIRNLIKHPSYSWINISGLTIGLSCFLFIALFVLDELNYDQFQQDIGQIYRMDFLGTINGNTFDTSLASAPTAATMVEEYPEVIASTRLRSTGNWLIKREAGDQAFKEENVIYADKNFFEFFDINLVNGDPATCLERPQTLVINETTAKKIFGNENPVGEMVILDNETNFEVTGVYEDMPGNMHFHFDMMLSMESREESKSTIWLSFNFPTYLKLAPGASPDSLEAKFPALVEKYIGPEIQQYMGMSMDEFAQAGNTGGFSLFPMKEIHLKSDKLGDLEANGDIKYVYIFSAIALFILILACINFMNLSTARSANRAKEVGIRKVMGAYRQTLVYQFLSEAFMITLVSIILAFGLSYMLLDAFNNLANKEILVSNIFSIQFILVGLLILIVVGLLAGSYPAFYLSGFRPVEVLKGKLNLGMKSGGIRSTLVVVQFTVSIIMIIGTALVYKQLNYIQNKKLGFNKDQILMVHDAWLMGEADKVETFKNEALQNSSILNATMASFLPVRTTNNNNLWFSGKSAGSGESHIVHNYQIDHDYIETLGMEIVDGRNFSRDFPSDTSAVLINEAATIQFGLDDPVGNFISTYSGSQENPSSAVFKVVGVVKDFHYDNMRSRIDPLIFQLGKRTGYVSFKIQASNIDATVDQIHALWDDFAPGQPFAYSFLDDRFNNLYENEQRIGKIFGVFAFLAIFIACLGLYGLAAFTAEQRTKEIGIRKVLGASITQILVLLSKEFIILLGISFIIGTAIAAYSMGKWLNEFEYRIELFDPVTYLLAGFSALAIAWLTMSIQSFRAAKANPVNSLKDE
jgi:putative ABC transport system permease protein